MLNSVGEKTKPSGTPQASSQGEKPEFPHTSFWALPSKKDQSYFRTVPPCPPQRRWPRRIPWLIVSTVSLLMGPAESTGTHSIVQSPWSTIHQGNKSSLHSINKPEATLKDRSPAHSMLGFQLKCFLLYYPCENWKVTFFLIFVVVLAFWILFGFKIKAERLRK